MSFNFSRFVLLDLILLFSQTRKPGLEGMFEYEPAPLILKIIDKPLPLMLGQLRFLSIVSLRGLNSSLVTL